MGEPEPSYEDSEFALEAFPAGEVYVFQKNTTTSDWQVQQRLRTSRTNPPWSSLPVGQGFVPAIGGFGTVLAVSRDLLVVRATTDRTPGYGHSCFAFRRNQEDGRWLESFVLEEECDSVDQIVLTRLGPCQEFTIVLFARIPNVSWSIRFLQRQENADEAGSSQFQEIESLFLGGDEDDYSFSPNAMDLRGSLLIVGNPNDPVQGASQAGYATVFELSADGRQWNNQTASILFRPDRLPEDYFGETVCILSDDLVAVGSPSRDDGQGGVFLYGRSNMNGTTGWNQVERLVGTRCVKASHPTETCSGLSKGWRS